MSLDRQIDRFFKEFPDSPKWIKFWGAAVMLSFFVILGIYSNFRNDPDIVFACQIYLFMIIGCAIGAVADIWKEGNKIIGNYLSGKWNYAGLVPFIIGGIFGYFMVTQNQTIGLSFLQLSGQQAFLFVVIVAPVVEEWFFRWLSFPTLKQAFTGLIPQATIAALLITNLGFGLFHYYVYGANIGAIYVAAFLGIIYTIGNYTLKSGTFSIGAHMANNYLLWIAAGGVLFG